MTVDLLLRGELHIESLLRLEGAGRTQRPAVLALATLVDAAPHTADPDQVRSLIDQILALQLAAVDRAVLFALLAQVTDEALTPEVLRVLRHACLEAEDPLVGELPLIVEQGILPTCRSRQPPGAQLRPPAIDLFQYLWVLALKGLARPVLREFERRSPLVTDPRFTVVLNSTRFINAVHTGSEVEALAAFERMTAGGMPPPERIQVAYFPMLWYQQAFFGGIVVDPAEVRRRFLDEEGGAPHRQLRRDMLDFVGLRSADVRALRVIMDDAHSRGQLTTGCDLVAYNPIRAALSLGELDMAAEMLQQRSASGHATWLDHFFAMRLHLQDRDRPTALDHLRRLINGADRYGARGRIELEVHFCRELRILDLAELWAETRATHRPHVASVAADLQLIGRSRAMRHIQEQIAAYADAAQPILILGETGTGKDLIARCLHVASRRREEPFVAINCAAVNDALLEAELFGHVRGAYTGADASRPGLIVAAESGTLFLDEIGDTSPRFQTALLRLLENHDYRPIGSDRVEHMRCTVVAATNVDLEQAAEEGRFRRDLLYRLQQLPIVVPPLRRRVEDIPVLVEVFLSDAGEGEGACRIAPALMTYLLEQRWPGNIRQLRNEIERLRLHHPGREVIELDDFLDLPRSRVEVETRVFRNSAAAAASPAERSGGASAEPPGAFGIGNPQMVLRARLVEAFERYRRLTRKQVMQLLDIASATASRHLAALCAEGVIRRVCPTPAPRSYYFELTDSVPSA